MAMLTVRNLPDEVHRARRVQAALHGHSTEAEVREILASAVKPDARVLLGDALAVLGQKIGLNDEDFEALDQARVKTSAELLFGIAALPSGKRKEMLTQALDGLLGLSRGERLSCLRAIHILNLKHSSCDHEWDIRQSFHFVFLRVPLPLRVSAFSFLPPIVAPRCRGEKTQRGGTEKSTEKRWRNLLGFRPSPLSRLLRAVEVSNVDSPSLFL